LWSRVAAALRFRCLIHNQTSKATTASKNTAPPAAPPAMAPMFDFCGLEGGEVADVDVAVGEGSARVGVLVAGL
jgi:hypothetical protein